MAFTFICPESAVSEGGMGLFQAGRKSVLLLWPKGGELKAYRGRCPHADMPLGEAAFDGLPAGAFFLIAEVSDPSGPRVVMRRVITSAGRLAVVALTVPQP